MQTQTGSIDFFKSWFKTEPVVGEVINVGRTQKEVTKVNVNAGTYEFVELTGEWK